MSACFITLKRRSRGPHLDALHVADCTIHGELYAGDRETARWTANTHRLNAAAEALEVES